MEEQPRRRKQRIEFRPPQRCALCETMAEIPFSRKRFMDSETGAWGWRIVCQVCRERLA